MPGPLSTAHASIETECAKCHAAFTRTMQRDLCLSCHDHADVKADIDSGTGFHGQSKSVEQVECATCHAEHEGRSADIVKLDSDTFDHTLTDFKLTGSHAERVCQDCHSEARRFREEPSDCFSCHETNDSHQGQLGKDCSNCHKSTHWTETSFDHDKNTSYPLSGSHQVVKCALCHTNQRYKGVSTDCYSCHQINDYHQGNFGKDCKQCHQTKNWKENNFDHGKASEFALQGQHSEISCDSCHIANQFKEPLAKECVSCHLADDVHQGVNSADCSACHNTREWKNPQFDHQKDTDFPLKSQHAKLDCRICHTGTTKDMKLDTACFSCHQIDDVHQQSLGKNCARCHSESGWSQNVVFDHDMTMFPLIGMHSVEPCEACHESQQFSETPGKCLDCHQQSDTLHETFGSDCGSCHNPNDWLLWEFDHQQRTDFALEGAHADLSCQSCHDQGQKYTTGKHFVCADCHRNDDAHSGEFGMQCSRCHNNRSFEFSGETE